MTDVSLTNSDGDRLAKIIARAGLCSRRDAELWIKDGRVSVNGKVVKTPAFNVTDKDKIKVDGEPLAAKQGTRVWLYHKPEGLVVTEKDPEGRPTIFEALEEHGLPRVVTIGRLDINTEGLLLLTNDGGLKRTLELPATGWLRKYRVRAFGTVTQAQLDQLKDGIEVEGIKYGPIEAILERDLGSNVWLVVALREGKNREVKNVLAALGLQVNRLIRISYGPFQLGDLPIGAVETVKARVLREQLGKRLTEESGADFDSDMPEQATATDRRRAANPKLRAAAPARLRPSSARKSNSRPPSSASPIVTRRPATTKLCSAATVPAGATPSASRCPASRRAKNNTCRCAPCITRMAPPARSSSSRSGRVAKTATTSPSVVAPPAPRVASATSPPVASATSRRAPLATSLPGASATSPSAITAISRPARSATSRVATLPTGPSVTMATSPRAIAPSAAMPASRVAISLTAPSAILAIVRLALSPANARHAAMVTSRPVRSATSRAATSPIVPSATTATSRPGIVRPAALVTNPSVTTATSPAPRALPATSLMRRVRPCRGR